MAADAASMARKNAAPPRAFVDVAEVRRELDRRSLGRFLNSARPEYDWSPPHLRALASALEAAVDGPANLVVEIPVRHGKSELASVHYPVWRLARDPSCRVLVACYNATVAERFGRRARRLAEAYGIPISRDRRSVSEWETSKGGGFRAVGVGGGVTGYGFDVLVVDDPVRGREDADSLAVRERTWEWFTSDLLTRREPGASVFVVMSRWHEDDLTGRILRSMPESFARLRLPALAEPGDPLGRPDGEPLWPARFDKAILGAVRAQIGERAFGALYQQDPRPDGGLMFDPAAATVVEAAPAGMPSCRAWDLASTAGGGDYTAGVLMAGPSADGLYYVADVARGRWSSAERDRRMRSCAEADGASCRVLVPQDPGAAGKSLAEHHVRLLAGFAVETVPQTGSKAARAEPFAAQWQAGNVRLVRGPWNQAFLDEISRFPLGQHDDQCDAAAMAFSALARPSWPTYAVTVL